MADRINKMRADLRKGLENAGSSLRTVSKYINSRIVLVCAEALHIC